MSNLWEHPSIIAAEALSHLEDALIIQPLCTVDKTSDFSSKANGWKVGDTVPFKTDGDFTVTEFSSAITVQDIKSSKRSMVIDKHYDVSVAVTAREEALELDSFSTQVLKPAAYKLAEKVDQYLAQKIYDQASGLYTSTTLFESAADIALARKAATVQQLGTNRFCLVDLNLEATLLGQTWFNQAQTRGNQGVSTLQSGIMGRVMGMDFYASNSMPAPTAFTPGTRVGQVDNGAGGNTNNRIGGSVLTVDTNSIGTLKVGDRVAVAGCRRPLVISAALTIAEASTTYTLLHPITELIPDNAAVTIIGTGAAIYTHGAIFDDRSMAVAFPALDVPGDRVAAMASANGISIRVVKGYDLTSKTTTLSMDLLCGGFALDPRRITLVAGDSL